MSGLYYPGLESSLGIEGQPAAPMSGVGLQNLAPSAVDIFALQQGLEAQMLSTIAPPPAPRAPQAPAGAFYSPSTDKMFAGGMSFDARDVQSAFQAAQQFSAAPGARPPSGIRDWQPLSRTGYEAYLSELRAPRGIGENLILGARGAVGGVVSGVGRGLEMLGSTSVGPAIANVGEAITGQDEFDKQRSALIQQSNSTLSNILDAAVQGIPQVGMSLGAGAVGGIIGGAIGGPAGAAAGATATATAANAGRSLALARSIGAVTGLAATSFPQQLNSFYEAARDAKDAQGRPAYDVNDPTTKLTIAGFALGTSLLDVYAPGRVAFGLSKALTEGAQQAGVQALQGMARARAVGGAAARSGFEEAATEATQTLAERAVFDPEFRRQLNAQDWKALAPYIVEKYGEDVLIAAGAGALLGGGMGGAGRFVETRGAGGRERNLLDPTQTTAVGGKAPLLMLEGPKTPTLPDVIYQGGPEPQLALSAPVPPLLQIAGPTPPTEAAPSAAAPSVIPMGGALPVPAEGPVSQVPLYTSGYPVAGPSMPAPQVAPYRPETAPESFLTPGTELLRRSVPRARPVFEPPTPTTLAETEAGNRLLALRRQMELQQAQAQAATQPRPLTAAERDYEAALAQQREQQAQQAMQQGYQITPASVMTSGKLGLDNMRRNLITRFNGLTAAEQDTVLTAYGDNPVVFRDAVRRMTVTQVRDAQAYLNNPERNAPPLPYREPSPAVEAAAAPAPASAVQTAPTPTVQETQTNAPEVRQVEQGGIGQRTDTGGRLAGEGTDRNVSPQNQEAGSQAGGGNRAEQGRTPKAKGVVATLRDEGIELTTDQRRSLNEAEKKIMRYRTLLNCLRTP